MSLLRRFAIGKLHPPHVMCSIELLNAQMIVFMAWQPNLAQAEYYLLEREIADIADSYSEMIRHAELWRLPR
jgi:hypothetical protein